MPALRNALALVAVAGLAVGGCAARSAAPSSAASAGDEVVEVSNNASFAVVVKYYTRGGGPHPLGMVRPLRREVFVLPRDDVGYILVETESGERLQRNRKLVRIRRYEVDPATGERVGPVRVIR
ncbi:MAG TPA: hypothetical protein VF188_11170 [Longimicrobiales bacterium]